MGKKQIWIVLASALLVIVCILLVLGQEKPGDIIGICYRDNTTGENRALRSLIEQKLTEQGYQVLSLDADGDQAKQLTQLTQLSQRNCKALLVEPVMSSATQELLQALDSTGLPTVLFGRPVDTALLQQYPKIAWAGVDVGEVGALQAQLAKSLPDGGDLNGDGEISCLVLQGPEDHRDSVVQYEALADALLESPYVFLSVEYGELSVDGGRRLCKQALATYGKDMEVIFCGSEPIALGAMEAIADGGRTLEEDIYLISVGQKEAGVSGTAYLDPEKLADTVTKILLSLLAGKETEQITVVSYTAQ